MTILRANSIESIDGVVAGFTRRSGGVSKPPFSSLNLGLSAGDDRDSVLENRRRVFEAQGFDLEHLSIAGQVHGSDVQVVEAGGLVSGVDGLITTTPGIVLCITAADCAVVLLADPQSRTIGACHSGWRGTVSGVVGKTVAKMADQAADVSAIKAFVSPCISQVNFEVGEEVAAQFDSRYLIRNDRTLKAHVDLKARLIDQLVDSGIALDSIECSADCTYADTGSYFSYRAEGGSTGRMMGFIGLR